MNRIRALVITLCLVGCAVVHAQDKEGFVPVAPGENLAGETLPGNRLVAIAYGAILAALIAWVASVAARSRKVEDELAALRDRLEKRG
jgi:hypothetical protein